MVLLLSHLFAFLPFCAHAYDVELDGICYNIIGPRLAYVTHHGEWSTYDGQSAAMSYSGEVVIPEQIVFEGRTYDVISVGENAFAGCESLTSVHLPSSVRSLNACAFLGCTNLQQVSLTSSMRAFRSCAFTGCTSLRQVALPRHAELVDSLVFYCCSSLTSLTLPHGIRVVCQGALEHLPSLTDLYCFASIPPLAEQGAFSLPDQQRCTLHVPAEALRLYQESPLWSDFYRIVPLDDDDYMGQNYQRGDINDDGKVDAEDLELLRRIIVSMPVNSAVRWAADINGDGVVNAIDLVMLASEQRCF